MSRRIAVRRRTRQVTNHLALREIAEVVVAKAGIVVEVVFIVNEWAVVEVCQRPRSRRLEGRRVVEGRLSDGLGGVVLLYVLGGTVGIEGGEEEILLVRRENETRRLEAVCLC